MGVQLPPLAPPLPAQVAASSVRQYPVAMADRPDLSALKIDERARRGPQRHGRRVLVILTVGLLALGGTGYALLREHVPEVQTAIVRLTAAIADRDATAAALGDLQVNLLNAQREMKRNEELFQRRLIAEQKIDTARLAVDSFKARIVLARQQIGAADARIKMAEQDIDNCIVRAPFAGTVVSKDAQRGEMVSPISAGGGFTRTGIATLVDMTSLEIEVDVNESYIARVRDGQPVTAILDAYPDWQIPARVRTIIPSADRQKATVKVRI